MSLMIYVNGGIAIFATGLMSLMFMPVMYNLAYQLDYWKTAPANQLAIRDNLYYIFLALPMFTIGAIIVWMYMASARRDYYAG